MHSLSGSNEDLVLVIDAGTTNFKVLLFDRNGETRGRYNAPLAKRTPNSGWVEQDPAEFRDLAFKLVAQAVREASGPILAGGITNQRETCIVWDGATGEPLHPALVWEDERTAALCDEMSRDTHRVGRIRAKTGLTLCPYFTATKLRWVLDNVPAVQSAKDLRFGTVDSWLLYCLTNGRIHATDNTNASRTLLFNIKTREWDDELLEIFGIPRSILPKVLPSFGDFGTINIAIAGQELPILAVIGDQQSSLYAAGFEPGTVKVTYGTGIFPMRLLGDEWMLRDSLSTTLAVGEGGRPVYALEGKVGDAANRVSPVRNDPEKLDAVVKQLALETHPILQSLLTPDNTSVVADGGISQNDTLLEEQTRLCGIPIVRQKTPQATALGVAKLIFDCYC